ncbi:hypothetical protein ACW14Y_41225 [Kitasatospora sp. cg17-2]
MPQTTEHDDPRPDGRHESGVPTAVDHEDGELLGDAALADAAEFTHAVLHGLRLLRHLHPQDRGVHPAGDDGAELRALLAVVQNRLIPRIVGLRDALLRVHQEQGLGSYGDLAEAVGMARSTVSTKLLVLSGTDPTEHERWATGTRTPVAAAELSTEEALARVQPWLLVLATGTASPDQAFDAAELLRRLAATAGWLPGALPCDTGDAAIDLLRRVDRAGPQVRTAGELRALLPGEEPEDWLPAYGLDPLPAALPADDRATVLVYRAGKPGMTLPAAAKRGRAALAAAAERYLDLHRLLCTKSNEMTGVLTATFPSSLSQS